MKLKLSKTQEKALRGYFAYALKNYRGGNRGMCVCQLFAGDGPNESYGRAYMRVGYVDQKVANEIQGHGKEWSKIRASENEKRRKLGASVGQVKP